MGKLIPEWRLREIRNIADSIAFRASQCLISRPALLAEEKLLKRESHIRFFVNPTMEVGEAKHNIEHYENAKITQEKITQEKGISVIKDLYEVDIFFKCDLSTRANWNTTCRALLRELGIIALFSKAAKSPIKIKSEEEKEYCLEKFIDLFLEKQPWGFESARPRFTIAKLRDVTEELLGNRSEEVAPQLQTLLYNYLGPDGR